MGLAALARGRIPDGRRGPARAIPALVGASHLAAVVLFGPMVYMLPNIYGVRLVIPLAVLMLPYAAAGVAAVTRAAAAPVSRIVRARSP